MGMHPYGRQESILILIDDLQEDVSHARFLAFNIIRAAEAPFKGVEFSLGPCAPLEQLEILLPAARLHSHQQSSPPWDSGTADQQHRPYEIWMADGELKPDPPAEGMPHPDNARPDVMPDVVR